MKQLIASAAVFGVLWSSAACAYTRHGVVDVKIKRLIAVPGETELARFPAEAENPTFKLMLEYRPSEECPGQYDPWEVWPNCQEQDLCILRIEVAPDALPYLESNGGFYMPHGPQTVYIEWTMFPLEGQAGSNMSDGAGPGRLITRTGETLEIVDTIVRATDRADGTPFKLGCWAGAHVQWAKVIGVFFNR